MRNTVVFAGSSCPALAGQICENLGMALGDAELSQFANVGFLSLLLASHIALVDVCGCVVVIRTDRHDTVGRDERQAHDQRPREGCLRRPVG